MSGESAPAAVGRRQARRQALFLLYQLDLTQLRVCDLPYLFVR